MLFFLQAEDVIRDGHVTGVQTCALPIFHGGRVALPGQNYINLIMSVAALGLVGWYAVNPEYQVIFWSLFALALIIGVATVMPIGGADMPVVISLLNSYSGLAASMEIGRASCR